MHQTANLDELRRPPARKSVCWPLAEHEGLNGEVLDYGPRGVFLGLSSDLLDPAAIEHGTRLSFRVQMPYGEVTFSGRVRWGGWNEKHSCHGIGVRVDRAGHEGEKYLRPATPPPQEEDLV